MHMNTMHKHTSCFFIHTYAYEIHLQEVPFKIIFGQDAGLGNHIHHPLPPNL